MIRAPAGPWKQIDQNEHMLRPIKKTSADMKCPLKKLDRDLRWKRITSRRTDPEVTAEQLMATRPGGSDQTTQLEKQDQESDALDRRTNNGELEFSKTISGTVWAWHFFDTVPDRRARANLGGVLPTKTETENISSKDRRPETKIAQRKTNKRGNPIELRLRFWQSQNQNQRGDT
jgi:hypothetical protein